MEVDLVGAAPVLAPVLRHAGKPTKFYNAGASYATALEHVLLATLLIAHFGDERNAAKKWMINAESDALRLEELGLRGEVWAPPTGIPLWNSNGVIFGPLDTATAVRAGSVGGVVEMAAKVLSRWVVDDVSREVSA